MRKRIAPPPPDSFSSGSDGDCGPPVFRNIKVTIKNDSDGTPSLSESEDDRRTSRKKKRRSEKEKRRRLERKLAKREEELKLLSEQQRQQARGVKTDQPKRSVKERLGVRKEDLPPVTARRSLPQSSSENSRRDELLRRAEIRRQNQEKSPIPYQGKKGAMGSPGTGRRAEDRGKPLDRRRRNRRRRRRERGGGRGVKQMGLKEENEEMKAKLLDRGGTRGRSGGRSGARLEARLTRLAGSESQYDSESGSDSETDSEQPSRPSQPSPQSKLTGKMRSDEVKVEARAGAGKTGDGEKWKHDKFSEAAGGEEEEQAENKFSQHWSRKRRDRSSNKTGGRARSGSSRSGSRRRSRSRRTRSRSGRSKSRRKGKKSRRRGKFSRSKSRSSSSSSSSRSRSVSRRKSSSSSRSRSRGRSRTGSARRSEERIKKEGVNLGLSGSLAADTNTVNGALVKYSEPTEARKPKKKWRLYVFKVGLTV